MTFGDRTTFIHYIVAIKMIAYIWEVASFETLCTPLFGPGFGQHATLPGQSDLSQVAYAWVTCFYLHWSNRDVYWTDYWFNHGLDQLRDYHGQLYN